MHSLFHGLFASQISGHLWAPVGAYDALATITVTSGTQSSVTFSAIPQNYSHLEIRFSSQNSDTQNSGLSNVRYNGYFNNDTTATNYWNHYLSANQGSGSASNGSENTAKWIGSGTRNSMIAPGVSISQIVDYTNPNKNKTSISLWGWNNNDSANGDSRVLSGLWLNTSPINSITIVPESGTIQNYSQFSLYGVR